jgi:hypothetical protein
MSQHDGSYNREFILNNPIPAQCVKCGYKWIDGQLVRWVTPKGETRSRVCRDAIRAPTLENVWCFWCQGKLRPLDKEAYAARLRTLHLHKETVFIQEDFGFCE